MQIDEELELTRQDRSATSAWKNDDIIRGNRSDSRAAPCLVA
jgi:hypothetical protein